MMQTARGLHWWAGPFCLHIRGIAYWEQGSTQKCLPTRLATNLTPSVYFLSQTEFKKKNPTGCGAPPHTIFLKTKGTHFPFFTESWLPQITALDQAGSGPSKMPPMAHPSLSLSTATEDKLRRPHTGNWRAPISTWQRKASRSPSPSPDRELLLHSSRVATRNSLK